MMRQFMGFYLSSLNRRPLRVKPKPKAKTRTKPTPKSIPKSKPVSKARSSSESRPRLKLSKPVQKPQTTPSNKVVVRKSPSPLTDDDDKTNPQLDKVIRMLSSELSSNWELQRGASRLRNTAPLSYNENNQGRRIEATPDRFAPRPLPTPRTAAEISAIERRRERERKREAKRIRERNHERDHKSSSKSSSKGSSKSSSSSSKSKKSHDRQRASDTDHRNRHSHSKLKSSKSSKSSSSKSSKSSRSSRSSRSSKSSKSSRSSKSSSSRSSGISTHSSKRKKSIPVSTNNEPVIENDQEDDDEHEEEDVDDDEDEVADANVAVDVDADVDADVDVDIDVDDDEENEDGDEDDGSESETEQLKTLKEHFQESKAAMKQALQVINKKPSMDYAALVDPSTSEEYNSAQINQISSVEHINRLQLLFAQEFKNLSNGFAFARKARTDKLIGLVDEAIEVLTSDYTEFKTRLIKKIPEMNERFSTEPKITSRNLNAILNIKIPELHVPLFQDSFQGLVKSYKDKQDIIEKRSHHMLELVDMDEKIGDKIKHKQKLAAVKENREAMRAQIRRDLEQLESEYVEYLADLEDQNITYQKPTDGPLASNPGTQNRLADLCDVIEALDETKKKKK